MAFSISQLQNDQSIASIAPTALNPPQTSQAMFMSPVGVQKVNAALDSLSTAEVEQYPNDLPKYYMYFNAADYTRQSLMTVGSLTPIGTILLPLPNGMTDTNHVDYDPAVLGAFGAAIQAVEAKDGPVLKNVIASGQKIGKAQSFAEAWDATKQSFGQANVSAGDIGTGLLGGVANEVAGEATNPLGLLGFSPNQFFTILLKGPVYKRHSFTWDVSPRNPQESKALRSIIQKFNNWKAPGLAAGGLLFSFPKIFQVGFMPNSSYLYKFKPCVMEDFIIDYASSGLPTFFRKDEAGLNAPEGIRFTINLLEIEYWLEGDFKQENADGSPNNNPNDIDGPNRPGSTTPEGSTSTPQQAPNANDLGNNFFPNTFSK